MLDPLQPVNVILPTRDLIDLYSSVEDHFFFYREGVKSLVKHAITSITMVNAYDDGNSRLLLDVIHEFDLYEETCIDLGIYPKKLVDADALETIVDEIELAVGRLLFNFFAGQIVEIIRFVAFMDKDMLLTVRRF